MFFFSRNSRPSSRAAPTPESPPLSESPSSGSDKESDQLRRETPSSEQHRRISKGDSDSYYPSWLPKRPPPPVPASTYTSVGGMPEAGPSNANNTNAEFGGRKPTPRSVRILSLNNDHQNGSRAERQEPTDHTRVSNTPRAWSRATGVAISPTVVGDHFSRTPQPRFGSVGLDLNQLKSPSILMRLYHFIWPLLVLAHIPAQTYLDFNAVFILIQVAKFPNPEAPGVPGSNRNWLLGTAAYLACWFFWITLVVIGYELIYSFVRRWRVKRPVMVPIYLSSPAFNYVSMRSYKHFCFLQYIRYSAFVGDRSGLRDGLAETFWFYSQNLPTVALLLPRAGLCVALIFAFAVPQAGAVALATTGIDSRDSTYFRSSDGTLTTYAFAVLLANAAWTAWRFLLLLTSWVGLWIISGQGCAGICGPRYRWEEEETEKTLSVYTDNLSDFDALPWSWRESTRWRIQDAYDFCNTNKRWSKRDISDSTDLLGSPRIEGGGFEGIDQLMAAVGLPTSPPPARRGVLSQDFFREPPVDARTDTPPELAQIIPKVIQEHSQEILRRDREREMAEDTNTPLMKLPYPFNTTGPARMSSSDRVPFPPSPGPTEEEHGTTSGSRTGSGNVEQEELEDEFDVGEEEGAYDAEGENPSSASGRASGSMSSLGHPVTSRYPFQFRRPARGGSGSSHATPSSNSRSLHSRISQGTHTTSSGGTGVAGGRESMDSHSPRSHYTSNSDGNYGIPYPPRHPQIAQGRGRSRAGTVPSSISSSSASGAVHMPVAFPSSTRTGAMSSSEALPLHEPGRSGWEDDSGGEEEVEGEEDDGDQTMEMMEQPEAESENSHEQAEREDRVALLSHSSSSGPSPKSSIAALRHRASSVSLHARRRTRSFSRSSNSQSGSASGSGSGSSRSRAGSSVSQQIRSRTQSLIQSLGAASRSSVDMVARARTDSFGARLEEEEAAARYSSDLAPSVASRQVQQSHSRSGSSSDATGSGSGGENNTFGQPLRIPMVVSATPQEPRVEEEPEPRTASTVLTGRSNSPSAAQSRSRSNLPLPMPSGSASHSQSQRPSAASASVSSFVSAPETPGAYASDIDNEKQLESDHRERERERLRSSATITHAVSQPDISSAATSMITDPATMEGTSESSGARTTSTFERMGHMPERSDSRWRPM